MLALSASDVKSLKASSRNVRFVEKQNHKLISRPVVTPQQNGDAKNALILAASTLIVQRANHAEIHLAKSLQRA